MRLYPVSGLGSGAYMLASLVCLDPTSVATVIILPSGRGCAVLATLLAAWSGVSFPLRSIMSMPGPSANAHVWDGNVKIWMRGPMDAVLSKPE